jgi:hypothetical protein
MAILHRLISVGGETAGFLLPVFRAFQGANEELIQNIDQHDHVVSLEPIQVAGGDLDGVKEDFEVYIGGHALWAFRDQRGEVHMGNAADVQAAGRQLLSSGSLDQCPMAAAEMAAFCKAEADHPDVLMLAFEALGRLSKHGAETWRDTVMLLPLIKQDLERQIGRSGRERVNIDSVFAITRDGTTHIYAPASTALRITQLPQWRAIAGIFGIHEFRIHPIKARSEKTAEKMPAWSLFGIGGVARFVIQRPPFSGSLRDPNAPSGGAIVQGPSVQQAFDGSHGDRLIIAVVMSDVGHARSINGISRSSSSSGALKHAINIRPIGFGTPRNDKPSPAIVREALSDFDCVWIVANHRQRQTGTYWNSLSATNVASRFVRAASVGLIGCLETLEGRDLLAEAGRRRGFGLFGAARYTASLHMRDMIRRVLYSMLCEDAYLHSASKIVIVWPYAIEDKRRREQVALGAHRYDVEVIAHRRAAKHLDVVGFATNVQLSDRTERGFSDFCVSLVAGYGWNLRHDDGRSLLLENEGERMRIWPVTSTAAAQALLRRKGEYGRVGDLIVSNQTIPRAVHAQAEAQDWGLAHYSELGRWMRTEYRMGVFKDL